MTQENKELLLKDLCARLPYNVQILADTDRDFEGGCVATLAQIGPYKGIIRFYQSTGLYPYTIEEIRPYLYPLSSMTEKQKKELEDTLIEMSLKALSDEINSEDVAAYEIDFYNRHHIDYRGLIPMGLALNATGKNIY